MEEERYEQTLVEEETEGVIIDTSELEDEPGVERVEPAVVSHAADEAKQESAVEPAPVAGPSWSLAAFVVVLVLVAVDIGMSALGLRWYLSLRATYWTSLAVRTALLVVGMFLLRARVFPDAESSRRYVVWGWIGAVAGFIAALLRFIAAPLLWTFVNLAVEPFDLAVLAVGAAYFATHYIRTQSLTKKSV